MFEILGIMLLFCAFILLGYGITYLIVWVFSIAFGFSFTWIHVVAAYLLYLVLKGIFGGRNDD